MENVWLDTKLRIPEYNQSKTERTCKRPSDAKRVRWHKVNFNLDSGKHHVITLSRRKACRKTTPTKRRKEIFYLTTHSTHFIGTKEGTLRYQQKNKPHSSMNTNPTEVCQKRKKQIDFQKQEADFSKCPTPHIKR